MAMLQTAIKVEDDSKKDSILSVIADKYCRRILDCTQDKPKSAMEIANESRIPISTVYRRIQTLHDAHLVSTSGQISDDGKKFFLYKSKVKSLQTSFRDGQVEVDLVFN